jgi:hypothetical protein
MLCPNWDRGEGIDEWYSQERCQTWGIVRGVCLGYAIMTVAELWPETTRHEDVQLIVRILNFRRAEGVEGGRGGRGFVDRESVSL